MAKVRIGKTKLRNIVAERDYATGIVNDYRTRIADLERLNREYLETIRTLERDIGNIRLVIQAQRIELDEVTDELIDLKMQQQTPVKREQGPFDD